MMADSWSLPKQDGSQGQHLCPLRMKEIIWSEDVLVTRKEAYCPEAISIIRYFACCSLLVCISEQFANLVDGDNLPWV